MNNALGETLTAFEGLEVKVEDHIPLHGDRVPVLMHNTGQGKASGFDLGRLGNRGANLFHVRGNNLFHVRENEVTKLVLYFDRGSAFEAVGLSD
jgi:hypothetical protein